MASVELCQVEDQPEPPPWLAPRGKIFKIWTSRCSKNAFVESLFLLTLLNRLWRLVVFDTLHSSSPRFITIVYKIMLSQSVLWERRSILSCENAANMLVSKTESKMLRLWCCRNLRFSIYCVSMPWYNIQYSTTWVTNSSFLFLCKTLVFLFLPFLNFGAQIRCYIGSLSYPQYT